MNITKVSYTRKFNIGNYESCDLMVEAQLNEKDNPLEVWSILADNTEMWYINSQSKTKPKAENVEGIKPRETPSISSPFHQPSTSPTSIHWQSMPPPKSKPEKGPWEKCSQIDHPEVQAIIAKLEGQTYPVQLNGHTYWLLHDQESQAINGVGRRMKV